MFGNTNNISSLCKQNGWEFKLIVVITNSLTYYYYTINIILKSFEKLSRCIVFQHSLHTALNKNSWHVLDSV